jgi:hypothetical protein
MELKDLLLARNYKPGVINTALEMAKKIPRLEAIKKVKRKKEAKEQCLSCSMTQGCLPSPKL